MTFNSILFLAFLPLCLAGFWLPVPWKWRKGFLLVASYVFYGAFQPSYVLILAIVTVVDYAIGAMLASERRSERDRKLLLAFSVGCNLGLLAYFKYTNFLLDKLNAMTAAIGIGPIAGPLAIILPVGISFFTFQSLSYTIDIYRRQIKPAESVLDFAFFVSFFPHLVAGPIVRASEFLWQCRSPHRPGMLEVQSGVVMILTGLFQKIVLADRIFGPVADAYYNAVNPSAVDAWIGVLSFSGQIYCDFNGYTMCAIGVALLFGFRLPQNFNYPYAAVGFSDFWSRWHMSLSRWMRDYLYISVGGNRLGTGRTLFNLMLTMALVGLWHGAAWTFVVWGLVHGIYLAAERVLLKFFGLSDPPNMISLAVLTFVLTTLAWIPFRARSVSEVGAHLRRLIGPEWDLAALNPYQAAIAVVTLFVLVLSQHLGRRRPLLMALENSPVLVRAIAFSIVACAVVILAGEQRPFIYFQF